MSIYRYKHDSQHPFVMVCRQSLWDNDISLAAQGLWTRLLSRPDDWRVSASELAKSCNCSRDTIYKLLNELIFAGYAHRHQAKDAKNKFEKIDYAIFEFKKSPEELKKCFPHPEFPYTGKPCSGNADTTNTNLTNKKEEKIVLCGASPPPKIAKKENVKMEENKEIEERPIPQIKKRNSMNQEILFKFDDIVKYATITRGNTWHMDEMKSAWKILFDYPGLVNDGIKFIEGTIIRVRQKKQTAIYKKNQELSKNIKKQTAEEKQCQRIKEDEIYRMNYNKRPSGTGLSVRPSVR